MEIYHNRSPESGGTFFEIPDNIVGVKSTYEIGQRIGRGGNGIVHGCIDCRSGEELAIKFQLQLNGQRRLRFEREIDLLQRASHEHLIKFFDNGVILAKSCSVEYDDTKLARRVHGDIEIPFVVMEIAECNLTNVCKVAKPKQEMYLGQFRGLAHGLGVLHRHAIHRDLKPSNILVVGDKWVISDYGLCTFTDGLQSPLTLENERVGPAEWMSPEGENKSLRIDGDLTAASDVFQLAMIFWYVVTGQKLEGLPDPNNWEGPANLLTPLQKALSIDPRCRQKDGSMLAAEIDYALFVNRTPEL
jgi:eukaryotic-like serine/threonine-protein kinase